MKHTQLFNEFVNNSKSTSLTEALDPGVFTKLVKFDINVNDEFGTIQDEVLLAMGPDSVGVFSIGEDIEKFTGLKKADAEAYDEKPTDAFMYGMNNMMNGGGEMYLWVTGNRLKGDADKNGVLAAIMDIIPHECLHLTKKLMIRQHAKNLGIAIDGEDWIKHDYGQGEYVWPTEGDHDDSMVILSEEDFAWTHGFVCKAVAPAFIELAKNFIPELEKFEL